MLLGAESRRRGQTKGVEGAEASERRHAGRDVILKVVLSGWAKDRVYELRGYRREGEGGFVAAPLSLPRATVVALEGHCRRWGQGIYLVPYLRQQFLDCTGHLFPIRVIVIFWWDSILLGSKMPGAPLKRLEKVSNLLCLVVWVEARGWFRIFLGSEVKFLVAQGLQKLVDGVLIVRLRVEEMVGWHFLVGTSGAL